MVVIDAFTKFVFPRAVPDTRSIHVVEELTKIFTIFGNPRRLITDAGMPRGNGQVERANRSILEAIAPMGADTSSDNWDSNLEAIQQGINSTKHKTTDATPAELMFGVKDKRRSIYRRRGIC